VGHSMGGKCAMQFALSFAERVDKLVVVDIAPRHYEDPAWVTYIEAMLSVEPEKLESRSQADDLLKEAIHSRIYRQFLLSNLVNDGNHSYRWRPNLPAIFNAREEISAPVSGEPSAIKTLFIRGEFSPYIRDEDLEPIAQLFPESTTVSIPGCGHLVHIEARDRFNQLLIDFL
jgi:esterase